MYVVFMYWNTRTVGELEEELVGVEAEIALLRSRQLVLVNELDKAQAPQSDASRSLEEWVQAHVDVKRDTARDLVFAARRFGNHRGLHGRMLYRGATFDRTIAAVKLADTGVPTGVVEDSYGRDLAGVQRLISRTKHVTSRDEQGVFNSRFFTIQPNLDESRYRMWGEAPGVIGRTIDKAICDRADQLRTVAGDLPSSRGQRQLDAFTAMAQDSLDGAGSGEPSSSHVTVFMDARQDNPVETSAVVQYGPRVGPNTVEELLCTGRVRIVGLEDGIPVVTTPATRAIPPAIRHTVSHRDGACVIDGCGSRYRLEPHHIHRFTDGGTHHPDNLATVCWYHHHIAIHHNGYHIDPDSPPHRRRLIRSGDPPRPRPTLTDRLPNRQPSTENRQPSTVNRKP